MKRLVIDPGVLVSAFISPRRSAPTIILEAILDRRISILSCPALTVELTDVLSRGKFTKHTTQESVAEYIDSINECPEHVEDPPVGKQKTADPDDDYLIALANAPTAVDE